MSWLLSSQDSFWKKHFFLTFRPLPSGSNRVKTKFHVAYSSWLHSFRVEVILSAGSVKGLFLYYLFSVETLFQVFHFSFEAHFTLLSHLILRIQFKLNTALLSYCPFVCSSVTGVTSHISHIYKGINAMLIIRGPIKPYIFWLKIILAIFLAKTRPDKTIFSALTNLTIDFDFKLSKV